MKRLSGSDNHGFARTWMLWFYYAGIPRAECLQRVIQRHALPVYRNMKNLHLHFPLRPSLHLETLHRPFLQALLPFIKLQHTLLILWTRSKYLIIHAHIKAHSFSWTRPVPRINVS